MYQIFVFILGSFNIENGVTNGEVNGANVVNGDNIDGGEKIENLSTELFEVQKERDMLLEEVELLRSERDANRNIERVNSLNDSTIQEHLNQNDILKEEKKKMKEEIDALTNSLNDPEHEDKQLALLLKQLKELQEENTMLKNRLNEKDSTENKVHFVFLLLAFVVIRS